MIVGACSDRRAAPVADEVAEPRVRVPAALPPGASTIAARDYIGPAACGDCHPEQHAQWQQSLHRVMNAKAEGDAVIGAVDRPLRYRGGEVTLTRDGDGYAMTFARGDATVRYRVTRTIGHRGLQEYVGIQLGDGATGGREATGDEVRLPVGWWPRRGGWYPQPFFDPWLGEDDVDVYAPVREPWAERCPWCHSTYPFEQRVARAAGRAIGHGFEQYFVAPAGSARLATRAQVSTGISCESCHLGGRAHADGGPIHFVPIGAEPKPGAPLPTTFAEERRDARIVNTVCAQCHSGPSPRLADHAATRNSSEALDLAASPCTTARCTDCHDPHRGGASEPRAIAACIGCHEALAEPAAARAHAGSGHADVSCLDCHMPRLAMGIDRYVRSHRISSPTNRAMLAAAAPNACNLCHLDRSITWTLAELRARHDVRIAFDPIAYDDPDGAVGATWLASAEPDLRVMAAMAYARGPLGRYALPELLTLLDDPLPYVRAWATFAVEDVLGRKLRDAEYDPRAPREVRQRQIAALRALRPRR